MSKNKNQRNGNTPKKSTAPSAVSKPKSGKTWKQKMADSFRLPVPVITFLLLWWWASIYQGDVFHIANETVSMPRTTS